ncbi:hypothetical protein [Bradyrhizobium retamae]|uniref:Uncharacterized protein n=1 Tax=Bradyrhizobium retamae TaxID=1300035 RepID=A0A0R3MVE1_9BRAD|nr:hypothetical protein [Bradyrhizobium retamae]KRR21651.1 hypothetical protein CQ13_06265 [Bradyrhizobium retamae]
MKAANDNKPVKITTDLLEKCLDRVALAIDRAGDKGAAYLPIYERLESELKLIRANDNTLERARQRIRR